MRDRATKRRAPNSPESSPIQDRRSQAAKQIEGSRLTDVTQSEVATYIAAITRDLSQMAGQARCDMLAYLLDMAHLEAKDQTSRLRD